MLPMAKMPLPRTPLYSEALAERALRAAAPTSTVLVGVVKSASAGSASAARAAPCRASTASADCTANTEARSGRFIACVFMTISCEARLVLALELGAGRMVRAVHQDVAVQIGRAHV